MYMYMVDAFFEIAAGMKKATSVICYFTFQERKSQIGHVSEARKRQQFSYFSTQLLYCAQFFFYFFNTVLKGSQLDGFASSAIMHECRPISLLLHWIHTSSFANL